MSSPDIYIPGYPVCKNIVAKRNDTFVWEITGYNRDGTPFDFSNKTFLLQVKDDADSDETLIEMPNSSFSIESTPQGDALDIFDLLVVVHPKEFMDVAFEGKPYDLELTDDQDQTFTFYEGVFTVTKDISRVEDNA